jgi:VanZ family protein
LSTFRINDNVEEIVLRLNAETSLRAAGYAAILLIGVLSLVPGTLRPETGAPGQYEHLAAYLGAAALLALGSGPATQRWQALWLVPYAAALEIVQHFVPGRHSRFSDFVVSSVGAVLGIIVAFGIAPILSKMFAGTTDPIDKRV